MKRTYQWLVLLVFIFSIPLQPSHAETLTSLPASTDSGLKIKIMENGSVEIYDRSDFFNMEVDPLIYFRNLQWVICKHEEGASGLNGIATLGDGTVVKLESTVELLPSGLHIKYSYTPSKDTQVQGVKTVAFTTYSDWLGTPYQLGQQSGLVPKAELKKIIAQGDKAALSLGPTKLYHGISVQCSTSDDSHLVLRTSIKHIHDLWIEMDHQEPEDRLSNWKAGQAKSFEFTLSFNKPLSVEKYVNPGTADVLDADAHDTEFQLLLVKSRFGVKDMTKPEKPIQYFEEWLNWDTGTARGSQYFKDWFAVENNFLKKIGFDPHSNSTEAVETLMGTQHSIKLGDEKGETPAKVQVKVGDLNFENVDLVGIDNPTPGVINNIFFPSQDEAQLVGYLPLNEMNDYIFSMDFFNEKIYLRPLDSVRRFFFNNKPLADVNYLMNEGVMYCPIVINQTIKGYAMIDTGQTVTTVDQTYVQLTADQITSFQIDTYELMGPDSGFKPQVSKTAEGILTSGENHLAIAAIGTDILRYMFTTIDPRENKIYFEKRE